MRRAWLGVRGFMQAPLILEVPKVGKGQTAGWPVRLCPSHALGRRGCFGVLSNPMLALASWTQSSGKRESWVKPDVRGCKSQEPANRFLSGVRLGCLWPLLPSSHMTLPLKRAPGYQPREWVWGMGGNLWLFPAGSHARN